MLPGVRSGPWNSYDRAQLEDAVMVARLAGASQVRLVRPGYATIEVDLKHEKAAGDRESVQAAERSFIERTAPRKKEELTEEQKDARAAARRANKARQKTNKAEKKAAAWSHHVRIPQEEVGRCPSTAVGCDWLLLPSSMMIAPRVSAL